MIFLFCSVDNAQNRMGIVRIPVTLSANSVQSRG